MESGRKKILTNDTSDAEMDPDKDFIGWYKKKVIQMIHGSLDALKLTNHQDREPCCGINYMYMYGLSNYSSYSFDAFVRARKDKERDEKILDVRRDYDYDTGDHNDWTVGFPNIIRLESLGASMSENELAVGVYRCSECGRYYSPIEVIRLLRAVGRSESY